MKNKVIFDSNDYDNEEFEFILDEFKYLLAKHVKTPRGKIVGWLFISKRNSHYGAISNNGKTGFARKNCVKLIDAILSIESDSIVIEDDQGELLVTYYDHDGSNVCKIKPITESRKSVIDNKEHDFNKLMQYADKIPTVKVKK